jgi:transcriptional regulator of arginine metabolism
LNKFDRTELLKSLVSNNEIDRQEDLVELFKERGFEVTQATISRDIKNLGFTKIQVSSGKYKYVMSEDNTNILINPVDNFILGIEEQENLIRLDVKPGSSMHVKSDIQIRFANWIFAVIADDDSVLIIAKSVSSADTIYKELINR